jgi:c-di-GMP-binding flagellar brake protein YcgR
MQIEELKIGKKIKIILKRIDETIDENYELPSQIVDINDNSQFVISSPFYKSNTIALEIGDELIINFTHESGLYFFLGHVIGADEDAGKTFYTIKVASEIKRLQRREHFRLHVAVPIVYQFVSIDKEGYGQGTTKDVSGGGLMFVSNEQIEIGQVLDIFVRFSQELELKTMAEVIRCNRESPGKYEVSVLFCQLSFGKRETLIKYLFNLQRDNLKK